VAWRWMRRRALFVLRESQCHATFSSLGYFSDDKVRSTTRASVSH